MQGLEVAPTAPGAAHIEHRVEGKKGAEHTPGRIARDKSGEDEPHDGYRTRAGQLDELARVSTHRSSMHRVGRGTPFFAGIVARSSPPRTENEHDYGREHH